MDVWGMTLWVAAAGAVGGVVAALLSDDKGLVVPKWVPESSGSVLHPGFLGLMLVGAIAATLLWGLYGPLANAPLGSALPANATGLTLSTLAGAVIVGAGGSKWLSSQVDKTLWRQTANTTAQTNPADAKTAEIIANGSARQALAAANKLLNPEQG